VGICPSVLFDQIVIFTLSLTQWLQKASKMKNAPRMHVLGAFYPGTPGGIRTPDLRIRSPLLYPTELQALKRNKKVFLQVSPFLGTVTGLARMFHETPATTADKGVLGCSFDRLRTGSPCEVPFRYASKPIARYRGTVSRWYTHLLRARCAPLSPASGFPVSRSRDGN
jgi:hypothetical protein